MKGSWPFVVTLMLMIALVCIWPQIVLWAPQAFR
jgi:TRAP-type C4-dicarboxylate transport system permease large subunit